MARAYSLDLRERVVAAVGGGSVGGQDVHGQRRQRCEVVAAPPALVRRPSGLAGRQQGRCRTQPHPVLSHKAISDTVLASVTPDDAELQATGRDVVAALVGIAPKTSGEAMLATQMIGMHNAVADSLRMARESSEPLRACTTPTGCHGHSRAGRGFRAGPQQGP
jgi:hypothetical protein